MEPNNRNNRNRGDKNRRRGGGMWSIVLWALLLTIGVNYLSVMLDQARTAESSCEIAYSELVELVEEGKVKSIEFGDTVFTITPVDGFTYTDDDGKSYDQNYTLFTTIIPDATEKLITLCDEHGVTYTKPYQPPVSPILTFMVSYILPTVLMVGAFMLLMNFITKKSGGMGGIGGIGNVGKANAKVYMEKSTGVTFADVAGQDEAKESLVEIIDFLHNPEKYTAIGAKIPKGALLVGSPGTGKTLLAKAVAGEAKVPFFSISGSDFVEMFVGVGASRVRDLFAEASKVAPCIIFIDEIDTIGKSRDGGRYGGGNDEREQTLNQLLAEMDGFDPSKGVIVLAATNRPEVLDKALLRPGRFDRRITVDRPNLAGRLATLQVHTRGIKLAEDVDLKKVALATAGCVGADLANLANEAALRAVRKGRKLVTQEDMLAAFEFVIAGSEKKGSVLTEFEKKLVAYHEVGHAMVAYKQKNAEPVQKITIVPHTEGSLGYTLLMPEEDKTNLRTRDELMAKIAVSMGGRAAAHRDGNLRHQLIARAQVRLVLFRHQERVAKASLGVRDDCDLLHGLGVFLLVGDHRVADLVIGDELLFKLGEDAAFLLAARDDELERREHVLLRDELASLAHGAERRLVGEVCKIRAHAARGRERDLLEVYILGELDAARVDLQRC